MHKPAGGHYRFPNCQKKCSRIPSYTDVLNLGNNVEIRVTKVTVRFNRLIFQSGQIRLNSIVQVEDLTSIQRDVLAGYVADFESQSGPLAKNSYTWATQPVPSQVTISYGNTGQPIGALRVFFPSWTVREEQFQRESITIIPYASVVIPLTLLSAWLLLKKPRQTPKLAQCELPSSSECLANTATT